MLLAQYNVCSSPSVVRTVLVEQIKREESVMFGTMSPSRSCYLSTKSICGKQGRKPDSVFGVSSLSGCSTIYCKLPKGHHLLIFLQGKLLKPFLCFSINTREIAYEAISCPNITGRSARWVARLPPVRTFLVEAPVSGYMPLPSL